METDIETAVSAYLNEIGAAYAIQYVCEAARDTWKCDQWRFTLSRYRYGKRLPQSFDYYTGLGLRKKPRFDGDSKPQKPHIAGLLYSLISDASACDQSFPDWCGDCGYDTDSMKAFRLYMECCENGKKLAALFSREEREKLAELLADY